MAQSFTDALEQYRLIVVAVDTAASRIRVKGEADVCSDLSCERTLVVSDEGSGTDLAALNPGDIIRLEGATGRPQKIVVLRRVWDELSTPEW